jgi:hypothetical protein
MKGLQADKKEAVPLGIGRVETENLSCAQDASDQFELSGGKSSGRTRAPT